MYICEMLIFQDKFLNKISMKHRILFVCLFCLFFWAWVEFVDYTDMIGWIGSADLFFVFVVIFCHVIICRSINEVTDWIGKIRNFSKQNLVHSREALCSHQY